MTFIEHFNNKRNSIKRYKNKYQQNPSYYFSFLKNKFFKFFYKIVLIPFLPIIIPVVLLLRIIAPFYTIRIGNLESDGIGHFSLPVEIYLSELELGIHNNKKTIDLWYLDKIVCNKFLKKKWSEHIAILPRHILKPIHIINKIIPGGVSNEIPYRRIEDTIYAAANNTSPWQQIDIHNVLSKTNPRITLSEQEKSECEKILEKVGFDSNKKYVCINIRDSAFHNDAGFQSHRNSSINDYHDAFEYLDELGYVVVRMGAKVTEELSKDFSNFFDYAQSGIRSEMLDLYLISKCNFFIGTGSGLDMVCSLFRKMTVFINFSMLGTIPEIQHNSLVIFRKLSIKDEILSIPFIIKNQFERITLSSKFEEKKIKLVKNSTQEIRDVIKEAHSRLNNSWHSTEQDEYKQELFRNYFSEKTGRNTIRARIGVEFLKSIIPD